MASTYYTVSVRNAGAPVTGLTPTWSLFKKVSDKTDIVSHPSIDEVGLGIYRFAYDPSAAEAVGQIDAGSSVPSAGDRYLDVLLTKDSSGNIAASVAGYASGQDPATVLAAATIPFRNQDSVTSPTWGDAIGAAWSTAFCKWTFTVDAGTSHWTMYEPDKSTQLRQFTLDSATSPTVRS